MNDKKNNIIKTKKGWLIATLCLFVFFPLFERTISLFSNFLLPFNLLNILLHFYPPLLVGLITVFFLWYFAYIRQGVIFLSYILFVWGAAVLSQVPALLHDILSSPYPENLLLIGKIAFVLPLCIWWCIQSLKLRKINNEAQKSIRTSSSANFILNTEKIKKQWLHATLLLALAIPIILLITVIIKHCVPSSPFTFFEPHYVKCLTSILIRISFLWFLWHFAYKKTGTAWLTTALVFAAVSLFSDIIGLPNLIRTLDASSLISTGVQLIELVIFIIWYIYSIKLRRLNQELQKGSFVRADSSL